MRRVISGLVLGLGAMTGPAFGSSCGEVVEDTVAELRAGASAQWSEAAEQLARAAAGAACVKARSERYGDAMLESSVAGESVGAANAENGNRAEAAAEGEIADDGSWEVGGLTFRSLGGSPGQKSYQRRRSQEEE